MSGLLKLTILGIGLLTGVAVTAQAQSVSSLPPAGVAPTQGAGVQPGEATQSFYPKPGGNQVFGEDHYRAPADYDLNPAYHPYSTSIGPKPGAHSSGVDTHYQVSTADAAPSAHPYTSGGIGPRPN